MLQSITFSTSDKTAEPIKGYWKKEATTVPKHFAQTSEFQKNGICEILQTSPTTEEKPSVGAESSAGAKERPVLRAQFKNGLVGCLFGAYNAHHNVVLRPEEFWIAVLTQFSNYVGANAEKLRNTFVDFQGKKELVVKQDAMSIRTADFASLSISMTDQIAANLKDAEIRDWILPSFTTTTANDRVVCSVVMMAAMQEYFSYKFELCCGIPNVTLLGTPDDYLTLLRKVDRLAQFPDLKEWHAMLKPIFEELYNASQGKHSVEFWSKICSHHGGGSGPSYLSGWITAFCCFTEKGKWQGGKKSVTFYYGKTETSDYPFIDTGDVPSGLVSVPVLVDDNGTKYNTRMIAGSFLLDLIDEKTLAPRLDWCIGVVDEKKAKEAQQDRYS